MAISCRCLSFFCVLLVVTLAADDLWCFSHKPAEPDFVQGKLLVKFRDGVDEEKIRTIVDQENGTVARVFERSRIHVIEVPAGEDISAAAERFSAYPEVLYAEPEQKAIPLEVK